MKISVKSGLLTVLLLMISIEASFGAYTKAEEVECLKIAHQDEYNIKWGYGLADQAAIGAEKELAAKILNQESTAGRSLTGRSLTGRKLTGRSLTGRSLTGRSPKHIYKRTVYTKLVKYIPDFAMKSETCSTYIEIYDHQIKKNLRNTKVGCGVDWHNGRIVVYCLYKHLD